MPLNKTFENKFDILPNTLSNTVLLSGLHFLKKATSGSKIIKKEIWIAKKVLVSDSILVCNFD